MLFLVSLIANLFTVGFVVLNIFNYQRIGQKKPFLYYFMCMTLFLSVEKLFNFILSYIPFYNIFRLVIVVYLSLPGSNNPSIVYKYYIKPFLVSNEPKFLEIVNMLSEKLKNLFDTIKKKSGNLKSETQQKEKIMSQLKQEGKENLKELEDITKKSDEFTKKITEPIQVDNNAEADDDKSTSEGQF